MCDVEFICLEDGVGILKNEEGELLTLNGNRKIGREIIAGTFFVVGVAKSGFITSLSEEHFAKYE